MARPARRPASDSSSDVPERIGLAQSDVSLLDVIDHVLNQGIVLSGDLTLGVADVDLISIRLLALISSADRVAAGGPVASRQTRARQRRRER
jgi:hypothetical protein